MRKLAERIYVLLGHHIDMSKSIQKIKRIYTCSDREARIKCQNMYKDRIAVILYVLIVTLFLAAVMFVKSLTAPDTVVLNRQGYGGDSETRIIQTDVDGKEMDVEVEVIPIEYKSSELHAVFQRGFEEIDEVYLGENASAEDVRMDLNLLESLEEMGLAVAWMSSDPEIVESTGHVLKTDDGKRDIVKLTAVLSYGEMSADRVYQVCVTGKQLDAGERAAEVISEYVKKIQLENRDMPQLELPASIEGYDIRNEQDDSGVMAVLLLGIAAAVGVWMGNRAQLYRLEKERSQSLMLVYPELVDKLILYLGAGVTVRGAFSRMVSSNSDMSDSVDAPLGREIRYMLNEIQSGVPEGEAYYNMGHRINIPVYMKLMSMLSQNVNKGTKDVMSMMAGEEQAALQTRKELAKKKGEEAGTRLLFPMIVLLGVVMVIVVLPAIMSF